MTTDINYSDNKFWNASKRILYAFQVLIITIAIPALSYMEVSHTDKVPDQPVKIISSVIPAPTAAIAYNPIIK